MTQVQSELIDKLMSNHCNVSDALEYMDGVDLEDFEEFLKDPDFKKGYNEALRKKDDFAEMCFMDLVAAGDKNAAIEFKKLQAKKQGENESLKIKREVMTLLINTQDTKTKCLTEYCRIFSATKSAAEEMFKKCVTEGNLITPNERKKAEKKKQDNAMAELFAKGKLGEIEMYSRMLQIALHDSEYSEYPSERSRAMDKVIEINRRLEEIHERKRREAEEDDSHVFDKLDAVLAGTSPNEIAAYREEILSTGYQIEEIQEPVENESN